MATTNPSDIAAIYARQFEGMVEELAERTARVLYGPPPYPAPRPTVRDVAARHFPRLHGLMLGWRQLRAAIAAARYDLGVRVIGYDPAPSDDEA